MTQNNIRPYLKKRPHLGSDVFIDEQACVIGDVSLENDCSVWPGAVIRGDMHYIKVGERSNVQDNAILHITHASDYNPKGWPLIIGDDVTIGHGACLHGCTVGNRVLIGINAVVLDGAIIQDEVIVAAGSLVAPGKVLESGFLYVGNPCRKKRALTTKECAFFKYSAKNYLKLKNDYLKMQNQDKLNPAKPNSSSSEL